MYQVVLFSDIHRTLNGKTMAPYRLANHLRSNGYTVKVVHGFSKITDEQFFEYCDRFVSDETLLVGLSATVLADLVNGQFFGIPEEDAKNRMLKFKSLYPKTKLCIGGAQVTGATNEYLRTFNYFDYAVKGQGENSLMALMDHLSKGTKLITSTITNPKVITEKTYPFEDFNKTLNFFTEDDAIQYGEGIPLELARGCIFMCKFCGYDLIGKKLGDFVKPADSIRAELLANYERWGITDYYISDETINDSVEKVDMLLESVQGLPFKPKFGGFMRLDLIWRFPEMAQKLLDWGMENCSFGIETINDKSGRSVGKGLGVKRIEQALENLHNVWGDKVYVNASFILGLPHDSHETALETDIWLEKMFERKWLHNVFVKPLYIMPDAGSSVIDQHYTDSGYRLMSDADLNLRTFKQRSVVKGQCINWETDTYDYITATADADYIEEKYSNRKICNGEISKHNYAYVKQYLPPEYRDQLLRSQIHDIPFDGMTFEETDAYIRRLGDEYFNKYFELVKKK